MRVLQIIWHNLFLVGLFLLSVIYTGANFFIEKPALHIISSRANYLLDASEKEKIKTSLRPLLDQQGSKLFINDSPQGILLTVSTVQDQQVLKKRLSEQLKENYIVVPTLSARMPDWLYYIGAHPLKGSVDLKGGLSIVVVPNIEQVHQKYLQKQLDRLVLDLRQAGIKYSSGAYEKDSLHVRFQEKKALDHAVEVSKRVYPTWHVQASHQAQEYLLTLHIPKSIKSTLSLALVKQIENILLTRLNALGISNVKVHSQKNSLCFELPHMENAHYLQNFLKNNVDLHFHTLPISEKTNVIGTKTYSYRDQNILVNYIPFLRKDAIVSAKQSVNMIREPHLELQLNAASKKQLEDKITKEGNQLIAIVYKTSYLDSLQKVQQTERLLGVIQLYDMLQPSFYISGLSAQEATELSFLFQAALPGDIYLAEPEIILPRITLSNIPSWQRIMIGSCVTAILLISILYQRFAWVVMGTLICHLSLLLAFLSLFRVTIGVFSLVGIFFILVINILVQSAMHVRIRKKLIAGQSLKTSIRASYGELEYVSLKIVPISLMVLGVIALTKTTNVLTEMGMIVPAGLLTLTIAILKYHRAFLEYFASYLFLQNQS